MLGPSLQAASSRALQPELLSRGVHFSFCSVERALELQVSCDEIDDGRWQIAVELFGGSGELERRRQRRVFAILQLLRG